MRFEMVPEYTWCIIWRRDVSFSSNKKRSERRKHCTLAVVRRSQKNFALPQTP